MQPSNATNSEPDNNNDQVVVFTRLWTENQSKVYAVLRAMIQDREKARDVLQDVSVLLWEKFASFEPGTSFDAWACQVARYHALNWRRKNNDRCGLLLSETAFDLLAEQAAGMVDEYEPRAEALRICLTEAPERYRELLEARYLKESPVHEIAARRSGEDLRVERRVFQAKRPSLLKCFSFSSKDTSSPRGFPQTQFIDLISYGNRIETFATSYLR